MNVTILECRAPTNDTTSPSCWLTVCRHVVDIIVDDMLGEDRATTVTLFLDMHRDIVNRRDYFYDEMESLKDRTGVYHHSSPCVAMKLNDDFLQGSIVVAKRLRMTS